MMSVMPKPAGIRGIHVAAMMVAFFTVVVGLDALFITLAVRSHPGEQVRNSYVLGLEYNEELARRAKQQQLGWTVEAGLADDGATLSVRLRDATGHPLKGMAVALRVHVAGSRQDQEPVWLTEVSPGEYATMMTLERPARMDARLEIRERDISPVMFEAKKTLVVP
jgi:nitrogen fixation protein FixH